MRTPRLRVPVHAQRTPDGDRRRRRGAAWIALAAMTGMIGIWVAPAGAVHDTGAFELDGNATNDGIDDWDNVCHEVTVTNDPDDEIPDQCTTAGDTSGATAVDWTDDGALNATIFTGGGSKDPQDIPNWLWKDESGGLPDKDNLLHAFAARYSLDPDEDGSDGTLCPAGSFPSCELLYFGSDRYDNSGDAQQGFWFLQDEVTTGGAPAGGGTRFTGTHLPGDLLVISEFSNGGSVSTIKVWEWDTSCTKNATGCADNNLRILAESEAANCATVAAGDNFCGLVNPEDGTPAPWSYTDKKGNSSYLAGEFLEAGVNLSALGLADRCFATVVAETRSSTSATATLKDFVLGTFGECETTVTTTPSDGSGEPVGTDGLSIGTGSVAATDAATIDVSGIATWEGSLEFHICGPIAAPATCDTGGVAIGSALAVDNTTSQPIVSDAATLTSVGRYCWRADFTSATAGVPDGSDSSATECFVVNPVTPTLTTQATDADGNPSNADVPLGEAVYDTAALSGTATGPGDNGPDATYPSINADNGAAAGGTITFTLVGPDDCAAVAEGTGTNPQDVDVAGDGTYGPVGFTPVTAGAFHWKASYSGDSPNTNGATHNDDCTEPAEAVTVLQLQPGMDTVQSFVPNDSATVTVASDAGGDLDGTVAFRLYVDDDDCSEAPAYESDSIDISTGGGSGTSRTVVSDNATAYGVDGTTFHWVVEYTSSNPAHTDVTSGCGNEHSSITVDNGVTQPAG